MDQETARIIVVAVTLVGALVWIGGLVALLKAARARIEAASHAADRFEVETSSAPGAIVGYAEVDGDPEDLAVKLASQLARNSIFAFGSVKILTADRNEVRFAPAGPSHLGFRAGRFRLTPSGSSKTRIDYAIETAPGPWLPLGWVSLALGLAALIAAPTLVCLFVLPSPNPQIRAQSIQVVQMCHFLWPPYLFAYRAGQPSRMLRAQTESLVQNLPYS